MPRSLRWAAPALLAAVAAAGLGKGAPADAGIPRPDRIRLAEAFRLARETGDSIWPGWSRAPFAVVLVTPENEFFVGHPRPPGGARDLGRDALLGKKVFVRPRTFPTAFLATFPVEGVSTIVVGQRENTNVASSTDWILKVLHEHFHQLQDSQPEFFAKTLALDLSRGDTTGMWMLDFPFPYETPSVGAAFARAAATLRDALSSRETARYRGARAALRTALPDDARRYLDFQIWKEGVARYTEIRVAERAAAAFRLGPALSALPDFVPFSEAAAALSAEVLRQLGGVDLGKTKRVVFYAYGAGEALLLDRERPCWREDYFRELFTLEPAFAAKDDCPKQSRARR